MDRDGGLESDLNLIRQLLRKYGWPQFENMVSIAARSAYEPSVSSSRASIMSTATSAASQNTSSSVSYYTDTASLRSSSSALSSYRQQHLPAMSARSSVSRTSTPRTSYAPTEPPPPLPVSAALTAGQFNDLDLDGSGDASRTKLQCPFCTEYGIGMWIGRKPDLKRHFNKIHSSNAQWTCKLGGGCNLTFDFHSAYDAHVKKEHGGVKDPDAKINLCQQVVFACGFERCREVFEAETDDHGPGVLNTYFEHVLSHVVSSACGRWSYSRRMRNLLHQETCRLAWKECSKDAPEELLWQPQSSSILRKMLECRHIIDPMLLCKYAVLLGSNHHTPAIAPMQLNPPILNTCNIASACHDPRHDPRFSKGSFLNFSRNHRTVPVQRHTQRTTSSHQPSRQMVRSPPPIPAYASPTTSDMFTVTAGPNTQPLPSYTPTTTQLDIHVNSSTDTTFPLDLSEPTALPTLEYHPLELYSAYQSLGEPPSLHQFLEGKTNHNNNAQGNNNNVHGNNLAQHTHIAHTSEHPVVMERKQSIDMQRRPRRSLTPGGDYRMGMGEENPRSTFPSIQTASQQHGTGDQKYKRRSPSLMDFELFPS